jgi:hypothetical protein
MTKKGAPKLTKEHDAKDRQLAWCPPFARIRGQEQHEAATSHHYKLRRNYNG